jgi:hypothetical protein
VEEGRRGKREELLLDEEKKRGEQTEPNRTEQNRTEQQQLYAILFLLYLVAELFICLPSVQTAEP